jgi:beta-D-xylosidase 4
MKTRYPNNDDAVAAILRAGTDVNCGIFMQTFAPHALANGTISEADLDVILRRQFRLRTRLGHFDPPSALDSIGLDQMCTPFSLELARDAARQSAVLAKNEGGVLPLAAGAFATAVVIGPLLSTTSVVTYYGSVPCNSSFTTPLDAVREHIPGAVGIMGVPNVTSTDTSGVASAAAAAAGADLVLLTIGSDRSLETEGLDRSAIDFSPAQAALVAAVAAAAKGPVVALVFSGGAMDIAVLLANPKIAAVVVCGQPSVAVEGTLDAVFGRTPDGRAVAMAGRMSQTTYAASFTGEVDLFDFGMRPGPSAWPPGTTPGRTYRFYTGVPTLPYGYGLSFTTWAYTPLPGPTSPSLARLAAAADAHAAHGAVGHIPASLKNIAADFYVNVTNTGSVDSDDVVLGFLVPPGAGVGGV